MIIYCRQELDWWIYLKK